mgnify:CR=1 FL=1
MKLIGRLLHDVLPPIILLVLLAMAWQAAIVWFDPPQYLFPGPLDVIRSMIRTGPRLAAATWLTATEAVCGIGISIVLGVLIAVVFSQARIIRASCYPYAVFLQTVPIVAVAPLIIRWLGTGFHSVVVVSVIISLFPIITNTTTGLLSVDPDLADLFRLHDASRWQILWKLRLPHSVPYLVTGVRTSSGLAVIGAIVGEFFAGYGVDQWGLGYLIMQTSQQLKTDGLFAAVFSSTFLGVAIFAASSWLGSLLLTRFGGGASRDVLRAK